MRLAVVCATAFLVAGLTLFSGFGLGTILMPAFALFFPIETAVAMTAIVHFSNNVFKLGLLGRRADVRVLLRFGLPAMLAAYLGARSLGALSLMPPLRRYEACGHAWTIMPVKLTVGALMAGMALLEISPRFSRLAIGTRYLPIGGALSGFFGGLSGQQGALRSAFLIRCGLSKESFIATGVAIACCVDTVRFFVYSERLRLIGTAQALLVAAACAAAFLGAFIGNRLLSKVTLKTVQRIVVILLLFIGAGLASGLL